MKRMTRKRFIREYQPILDDNGSIYFFDNISDMHEAVTLSEEDAGLYVWTWISGDGDSCLLNGYRLANRIGYTVCKKAHEGEDFYVPW
jgi:hypothetical protein